MDAETVRRVLRPAILGFAVAACTQAGSTLQPPTLTSPPSIVPTAVPTPSPTAEPAPTPRNPAPAEMLGRWRAELGEGDIATLDITANLIRIARFATATVRLEVFGDELVLSHSQLCEGEGRYRWSIDGDKLRFDSIEVDPCDGRAKSFDGVTYTRVQT